MSRHAMRTTDRTWSPWLLRTRPPRGGTALVRSQSAPKNLVADWGDPLAIPPTKSYRWAQSARGRCRRDRAETCRRGNRLCDGAGSDTLGPSRPCRPSAVAALMHGPSRCAADVARLERWSCPAQGWSDGGGLSAAAGEHEGRSGCPRSGVGRGSHVIRMAQVDADHREAGPAVQQPEEIGDDK